MKELYALRQLQSLPLDALITRANNTIREWTNRYSSYLSTSGGLDSNFLYHLCKDLNRDISFQHVNTTVEFPEIEAHIKYLGDIETLYPKMCYRSVCLKYGYPLISKKVSRFIRDLQRPEECNPNVRKLRLTGYNRKGIYCPSMKIPKKWIRLSSSGYKISEQCCDILKKNPLKDYEKISGRKPITGVMAEESNMREKQWLQYGCSLFNAKHPICHPLSVFTRQHILLAHKQYGYPYASIYGKIKGDYPNLYTTGEKRTGCMGCMYGCHLEENPNRFQRLEISHPKYWDYFINRLGQGKLLDLIGVKYTNEVKPDCSQQ